MTTEIKLNTLIEWTAEDRAKGKCPVPDGSDVTVWFGGGLINRNRHPEGWIWSADANTDITAYLVHSVPREPVVRWVVVGDSKYGQTFFNEKLYADEWAEEYGGLVVKLVEEIE